MNLEKMKLESPDLTQANVEKLKTLFPSVVTEARDENGSLKSAVNFESLRQLLSADTEAAKAGYKNICEIGKERIRRAGEKIKQDNAGKEDIESLGTGFRVLKCDSSNMKEVYSSLEETDQASLKDLVSNIKEDRTDLDLLFGCILEWGLPLSLRHETEEICGFRVHFYDMDALACCFDASISEEAIKEIAKRKPLRAVFRDASFADSQSCINAGELFKTLSPDKAVKVI